MLLPRDRLTEEQYRSGRGFGFISMMVGRIGERKKKRKEKRERERERKLWSSSPCIHFLVLKYRVRNEEKWTKGGRERKKKARVVDRDH